jgi:integrase
MGYGSIITMPHRLPPGCIEDVDRHGNIRIYFRRKGAPKVRLREMPWTPAFMTEYEAAKGQATTPAAKGINPGTWRWLCVKFFSASSEYKCLSSITQSAHRWALEGTYDEPIAPGSSKHFRDMPLSKMNVDAIEVLRDRKMASPEGANKRVKAIRAVFKWALAKKLIPSNPAKDVSYLRNASDGYHTWIEEEVQQFENHHPIGSKAHLALTLGLYTGMRRSDAIRLGKQHVKDGEITFTVFKGRNKKLKRLTIQMLPALQTIIDATPCCGDLTFLVTEKGTPFKDMSFSKRFKKWCNQAGLPKECVFHGLRKAGATRAANEGATTSQLMAIFGWDSMRTAEIYTRAANQQRLAKSAMHLLESGTKKVPLQVPPKKSL